MAIYRLEAKIFSRKKRGRSVVAGAAYRAGANLKDDLRTMAFNYSPKGKGVIETAILAPEGAPDWCFDTAKLWNTVERCEKRVDSQLAREFILAVPRELTHKEQFEAAVRWAKQELVSKGMVAQVCLHRSHNDKNPHVHILATMRKLEGSTFSLKKSREWNEKTLLNHWRKTWEVAENAALEKAGRPERVDCRSLKDRGIDRIPEPKIGVAATAMKRRGLIADPINFQRVRAVKLWNATRPVVQALAAEYIEQTQNLWNRSLGFVGHVRDLASKPFRHLWNAFTKNKSSPNKSVNPDITR